MLVSKIIDAAMRKLGVVASGETISHAEQQDGLSALQSMLRSWSAARINVFSSVHETFTLTPGISMYTWGVGGDINTLRPNKILGAAIADASLVTYPVDIISEGKYRDIAVKLTSGRPYYIYPSYTFPYVTIYIYPVADSADNLVLDSLKPFTETSSFSAVADELQMPSHYEEPVIYNLALRLAPEFGKVATQEIVEFARSSYDRLITLNASNFVESVRIDLPVNSRGRYSINSDT